VFSTGTRAFTSGYGVSRAEGRELGGGMNV